MPICLYTREEEDIEWVPFYIYKYKIKNYKLTKNYQIRKSLLQKN